MINIKKVLLHYNSIGIYADDENDPNNKIIWGVVGLNGTPNSDDLQRMTIQLNQMGVKSASGMVFTPERLRSAYYNLKRIYK